jgi:hypothetical protein
VTTAQQRPVNAVQTRLAGLSLLERAVRDLSEEDLTKLIAELTDEQRTAMAARCGGTADSAAVRRTLVKGRMNGLLEGISTLLADKSLADCIEVLGDSSDNPTEAELNDVLPGLVERHGAGAIKVMLATAIVGEAPASPILKDILKSDAVLALPPAEAVKFSVDKVVDPERDAILATRKARKDKEKAERAKRR